MLGDDILNPFTGLSVKDYLEGREDRCAETAALRAAFCFCFWN